MATEPQNIFFFVATFRLCLLVQRSKAKTTSVVTKLKKVKKKTKRKPITSESLANNIGKIDKIQKKQHLEKKTLDEKVIFYLK